MFWTGLRIGELLVALLAEGVDRNPEIPVEYVSEKESPSSRRAWIEIMQVVVERYNAAVALLAEGVDRNQTVCRARCFRGCRPPRGGRG